MMVSDPESEQELAESHLMPKNDCLCFRMSSSFVGNNPSQDRGKCNKTCNASISDFSTILTSYNRILADSSHLPSDEAYRKRIMMSLPCNRLSTPCYECNKPVPKAYRKCCVKFLTTPSVRTGFPAVIQHSHSEHLKRLKPKNLRQSNFSQSVFFRAQNAFCGKHHKIRHYRLFLICINNINYSYITL